MMIHTHKRLSFWARDYLDTCQCADAYQKLACKKHLSYFDYPTSRRLQ